MFAVSGWNLPTGPATQVDTTNKKKTKRGKTKKDYASGANSVVVTTEVKEKIKERERAQREKERKEANEAKVKERAEKGEIGDTTTVVTKDNVNALYEKVIEGKVKDSAGGGSGKKRKRGEKNEGSKAQQQQSGTTDDTAGAPPQKKKKTLKEKKREKRAAVAVAVVEAGGDAVIAEPTPPASAVPGSESKLTPLQRQMREKLTSARFRHINETLYTSPSTQSFELFKTQPEMYSEYHAGFRRQVEVWPENPVEIFIRQLTTRAGIKFQKGHARKLASADSGPQPLPRDRETGVCTVADLGCGDAKIAATFNHGKKKKEKVKVLSYDLQVSTPDVTMADIANLPLEKECMDVVIFCLALMGTNFLQFVEEAHRILKWGGELWVAEIKSRFNKKSIGGRKEVEEADVDEPLQEGGKKGDDAIYKPFVEALSKRGFVLRGNVDDGNKMFVRMEFVKMPDRQQGRGQHQDEEERIAAGRQGNAKMQKGKRRKMKFIEEGELTETQILKPCVYKQR